MGVLHLITGHAGTEHVTSSNAGALNAGIFGSHNYVLNYGMNFHYVLNSNNSISIFDGQGIFGGRQFEIPFGSHEELTISNGSQNLNRIDLICAKYNLTSATGIETVEMVIVEGTPAVNPVKPTVSAASIIDGASTAYFPMYQINITGLSVTKIDTLFSIVTDLESLSSSVSSSTSALGGISFSYNSTDGHFYATDGTHTKKLGSSEGSATTEQVLAGATFGSANYDDVETGTMVNRANWSSAPSDIGKTYIPEGYHNGSGYVDNTPAYNKGASDNAVYYLGTGTSYNIGTLFPTLDISTLTNDNFLIVTTSASESSSCTYTVEANNFSYAQTHTVSSSGSIAPAPSYNASTGVLTITGTSATGSTGSYNDFNSDGKGSKANITSSISGNIKTYLVLGTIQTI